jgi:nicotinamide-nucleotide amidase
MQRAWIISIGTELALGQSLDTNSGWLAEQLAGLGIRAQRHVTVADDLPAIVDALRAAAAGADVVLVSGGLGPTDDDLTRTAMAQAAGVALDLHEPSVAHLRAYFASRGRDLPASNLVQARLPRGARVLENTCGTAPGMCMVVGDTPMYVMPGVPFEMKVMFAEAVAPELAATAGGAVLRSRRLHSFGLGESDLGERIADLMVRGRNPEVGTSAALGVITIRINAQADDPATADAMLDETEAAVRQRLGTVVFGADGCTLAAAVGRELEQRGQTLATAESCTGGLIGELLTAVPGSSAYYVGGAVAYSNELKERLLDVPAALIEEHGAVSEPVAVAMARGACANFDSAYAISVTGVAGPGGGSEEKPVGLVCIGLATPHEVTAKAYRFGSDSPRDVIRHRAAHLGLNSLRRAVLAT